MASKGKKITLLDASGMLSKEALLGYVYNELQPAVREDVERLLAQNEMFRDMVEGLKHIPNRAEAEKVIYELNVDVAERSGSMASVPGVGESVGDFFWNYRRVAAVVGTILIASAAVFTFAILQVSGPQEMASKEEKKKETEQRERAAPSKPEEVVTPPPALSESLQLDSFKAPDADLEEEKANTTGAAASTGNTPPLDLTITSSNAMQLPKMQTTTDVKKKANAEENNKAAAPGLTYNWTPTTADTVRNEDLAIADDVETDKVAAGKYSVDEKVAEEQRKDKSAMTKQKQEVLQQSRDQGYMMNSSGTQPSYLKNLPRTAAEQMPVFPGGQEALVQYLQNNLKYPPKAKSEGVTGKVDVSFVIGTGGRVKEITVLKGVTKELNAEAIRLIASMPKWEPGKEAGKPVEVILYQTIEFK